MTSPRPVSALTVLSLIGASFGLFFLFIASPFSAPFSGPFSANAPADVRIYARHDLCFVALARLSETEEELFYFSLEDGSGAQFITGFAALTDWKVRVADAARPLNCRAVLHLDGGPRGVLFAERKF